MCEVNCTALEIPYQVAKSINLAPIPQQLISWNLNLPEEPGQSQRKKNPRIKTNTIFQQSVVSLQYFKKKFISFTLCFEKMIKSSILGQ